MSFRWIQIRGKSHCRFQSNRNYMCGTERIRRWPALRWLDWTDLRFRRSDLKPVKWSHILIPSQLMVQARESADASGPFLRPSCQRCVEGPLQQSAKMENRRRGTWFLVQMLGGLQAVWKRYCWAEWSVDLGTNRLRWTGNERLGVAEEPGALLLPGTADKLVAMESA